LLHGVFLLFAEECGCSAAMMPALY
jgi:hypothetical protein